MSKIRTSVLMTIFLFCVLAVTSLLLVFGFGAPSEAGAVESTENNTPVVSAVESHGTHSGWTKLTTTSGTIENTKSTEAKYYLNGNLDNVKITFKGKITLCLNNYCLDGGNGSVITVAAGATFTLCDCKHDTDGPGRIRYGNAETGGGVHVNGKSSTAAGGKFIMKGGAIRLCTAVRGGAVWVGNGAEFELQYGRIRMNNAKTGSVSGKTENGNGAGVYVATGGKFTMTGGELLQNTAEFSGGGVYVANSEDAGTTSGLFDMQDGLIANNVAQNGGGVSLNKGAFTMSGGTIGGTKIGDSVANGDLSAAASRSGGNTASVRGGGVFNAGGTTTISGDAKIKFNNAPVENELGGGGGIHVVQNSTGKKGVLKITGGEISGNESWRGGGVFAGQNSEFTISGGSITDNKADSGNGGGVLVLGGTVNISGNTVISNNKFAEGISGSGGGMFVASVFDSSGNKTYEGNVTMTGGNINENQSSSNGGGVLLDRGTTFTLSGGEINGNTASAHGGGVYMGSNAKLTMTGGKINGNEATGNSGGGVCIAGDVSGAAGEFTMEGGEVNNNTASFGGGISSIGDVTIKGGTVSGNNATGSNGGGIFAQNKTLTLENATVSNNTAATTGGGVYVNNGCAFSMTSGTINGNSATANGGGVYVDSTFSLSGGKVFGNTVGSKNGNVYLTGDKRIAIVGTLDSATKVGVTMHGNDVYVITSGFGTNNGATQKEYFESDSGECLRITNGEVAIGHSLTHYDEVVKCTEEGNVEYWECDNCEKYFADEEYSNELKSVVTAAAGHDTIVIPYKAATCTATGMEAHVYCNRCKKHFTNDTNQVEKPEAYFEVAKLNHVYEEVSRVEASCTEDGHIYSVCKTCDADKTETILAHHTVSNVAAVAPSCTQNGNIEHWHCSICKKNFETEDCKNETSTTLSATGHKYGNPVWTWSGHSSATATFTCANDNCPEKVHTETATTSSGIEKFHQDPSCTVEGKDEYTAKVTFGGKDFTDKVTEVIDRIAHVWTAVWSWSDASGDWTATVTFTCNATTPHSEDAMTAVVTHATTKAPDCIHVGTEAYTARVSFNEEEYTDTKAVDIAATGEHTYANDFTVDTAATCTAPGSKSKHCTTTGCTAKKDITSVAAIGHSWTVTPTDGTNKTYTAFDEFSVNGLAVTFVCANDASHNETLANSTSTTVTYASGDRLHYGDTTVTVNAQLPNYGAYAYTVSGIKVNLRAATNVVWEYSSNGSTWTALEDYKSMVYDGKTYSVRVRFAKNTADDNTDVGTTYINVFDSTFKNANANGYGYTLSTYGNYSISDSSRTVIVTRYQVSAEGGSWESNGAELMSGYVKQTDAGYKYYSASTEGATAVTNAVVRYISGTVTVVYYYDSTLYSVTSYTGNTADEAGMYNATATLTLADPDNYEFITPTASGAALNDNGTITVTKRWYAAICDNGFVGSISGWAFGSAASSLPALENDDGNDETVTLVLKRGGTTIGTFDRGDYSYYINNTMPTGNYTLIATVEAVTVDGITYEGFSDYQFTFTVRAATLTVANGNLQDIVTPYDGQLHIHQDFTPDVSLLTVRSGEWANEKHNSLYSSSVTVTFSDGENGTFVSATEMASNTDRKFIKAGVYEAYCRISALNYSDASANFNVTITKLEYDLTNVAFAGDEVTYNGEEHSLSISNLPDGVSVAYTGNGQTNANEAGYTVTATLSFTDTDNYKFVNADDNITSDTRAVYTATLIINKATFNVTFENDTVKYDGSKHYLAIKETLPSGITVSYANNGQENAGRHIVLAQFTCNSNYNAIADIPATLEILQAEVTLNLSLSKDSYDYSYDGAAHSIVLNGTVPDEVEIDYTQFVNPGEYTGEAVAKIKSDYAANYKFADGTVTKYQAPLTITVRAFDMTGVSFNNKTVTYTGNSYSLSITGNLPAGVTYSYENNGHVNAGRYTVIVHFYHNYSGFDQIEDMKAELWIQKATYDLNVTFPNATVAYTGNAHSLSIRGALPAGVTYRYTTSNSRTNVGTQIVTVSFSGDSENYEPIADMRATLTVIPASYGATSLSLEGMKVKYDGASHGLAVMGNLPENVTVKYYVTVDGNEVESNGATEAGVYDVIARFVLPDEQNYKAIRPLNAKLTILPVEEPTRPPVVVEPSVAEIDPPIVDNLINDQQANAVVGEIVSNDDFPYWIIAVCVIAAEVVAMAVMGCYIAFRSHKKKKR